MTNTHYVIAKIGSQSAVIGHEERRICEEAVRRLAPKHPEAELYVVDETGEPVYCSRGIRINLWYVGWVVFCLVLLWNL